MSTTPDMNKEREAFETFVRKRWGGSDRGELTRKESGYATGPVDFAWSAFQAGRASSSGLADPLQSAREDLHRTIEAQPDDGWRILFAQVAGILKCLPSSFLDGNAHVLRQAKLMADQYRAPEECQQCFGSGEVFEHTEDCADDHCALNGDEHSCVGVVRPCSCQTSAAQAHASLAASAGSEPVAWRYVPSKVWGDKVFTDDPVRAEDARQAGCIVEPLYTHPSPPEGMAVTDAMIDAGKKMLHNSNGRGAREKVERIFNAMIAAAPPASEAKGAIQ